MLRVKSWKNLESLLIVQVDEQLQSLSSCQLSDTTLYLADGSRVRTHFLVLAAGSSLFRNEVRAVQDRWFGIVMCTNFSISKQHSLYFISQYLLVRAAKNGKMVYIFYLNYEK